MLARRRYQRRYPIQKFVGAQTTTKMARSITMLETRSMSYSTSALSNKGARVGSPKTRDTNTSPSISAGKI